MSANLQSRRLAYSYNLSQDETWAPLPQVMPCPYSRVRKYAVLIRRCNVHPQLLANSLSIATASYIAIAPVSTTVSCGL